MTVQKIKLTVAEHFGITVQDIDSRRRPEHIAWPRQIAITLVRAKTARSLDATGEEFDRTKYNIMYACRKVYNRVRLYEQDRNNYQQILRKLGL